ncbi:MAG: 3'-5' exonuclease [Bacillota bacterium]
MKLNSIQEEIIYSEPSGHSLVKGVAGSGKTTIGLGRVKYLKNNYLNKNDRILFVTYSNSLINYSKDIYKDFDIKSFSLFSLNNKKNNVYMKTIKKIIYELYKKYSNEKLNLITSKSEIDKYLSEALSLIKNKYNTDILNYKNKKFLIEEFDWIKGTGCLYLDEYLNIDRLGRGLSAKEGPVRLKKASKERYAIHDALMKFEKLIKNDKKITFSTMTMEVKEILVKENIEKYQHIIIDESQDLSKVQLEILSLLYDNFKKYSTIMFLADTAQSINVKSWISPSGRSFKNIGFDMKGRSIVLSRNYRTTKKIAKAAYSLIKNDKNILNNENYVKPKEVKKEGGKPKYFECINLENQYKKTKELIEKNLDKGITPSDIAIVSKNPKNLQDFSKYLKSNSLTSKIVKNNHKSINKNKINLITMHDIKGLEYPIVIVINLDDNIIPNLDINDNEVSIQRKLLYVSMTRAKDKLYLLSSNTKSRFIDEIDSKLLNKVFNENSSELKNYKLIDLINKKEYKIKHRVNNPENLIINRKKQTFKTKKFKNIDSYGKIAAGNLEYTFKEKEGQIYIPDDFLNKSNEYFLLKVKGNSMIEINIEPDDFVLVKRQNYANNRDIIVAIVNDNSTLKRYFPMEDKVLLIPENNNYKPISIKSNQLYINGVVIGVIKNI